MPTVPTAPNPRVDSYDDSRGPRQPGAMARMARLCVRRRWIVIAAWVVLLAVANMVAGAVGPDYRTDFSLPDGEAKQDRLRRTGCHPCRR
jgi:hypothetical protein